MANKLLYSFTYNIQILLKFYRFSRIFCANHIKSNCIYHYTLFNIKNRLTGKCHLRREWLRQFSNNFKNASQTRKIINQKTAPDVRCKRWLLCRFSLRCISCQNLDSLKFRKPKKTLFFSPGFTQKHKTQNPRKPKTPCKLVSHSPSNNYKSNALIYRFSRFFNNHKIICFGYFAFTL